jgi:hypothetical protein
MVFLYYNNGINYRLGDEMEKFDINGHEFYAKKDDWLPIEEEIHQTTELLLSHGFEADYIMPVYQSSWGEQPIWISFKKNKEDYFTMGLFLDPRSLHLRATFISSHINEHPITEYFRNTYRDNCLESKNFDGDYIKPFQIFRKQRLLLTM